MAGGKKNGWGAGRVVLAIGAAGLILAGGCVSARTEACYKGRSAADWLELLREAEGKKGAKQDASEVDFAIDAIGPSAIPALTNALASDKSWLVREHSAAALGRMGARAFVAIPALVEALKDEHFLVWEAADSALNNLVFSSEQAVPLIADGIKHPDAKVRKSVIEIFGVLGPRAKAAVPAITGALKDNDAGVKDAAADALKQIEGK